MVGSKSFPKRPKMKKILLVLFFTGFLALLYNFLTTPKIQPIYLSSSDQIYKQEKPQPVHEIYEIVQKINKKVSNIKNIYIKSMPILLQQGQFTTKVFGELAMEKDKFFRLKVNHRLTGREMDIGSNDQIFWFWSKRMSPPALYYSKHENLNKTMLRSALNPNWMLEALNVGDINVENIEISKFNDFWAIIQSRVDGSGDNVTAMILIDPNKEIVLGRYLYNKYDKMIASTEYSEFLDNIPRKILIIWYEEAITLTWSLQNIQINTNIDPELWIMPNIKNKIDMAE